MIKPIIKSLQLGNKIFPVNIIQGPLAGVSCAPFRQLTWQYSQPAFSCTEMISCKTLIHRSDKAQQRFIQKDQQEGPVCFQLCSSDPQELAEAVKKATEYGADLIDLNCGCPVKKIRKKGAGSSLLTNPSLLYELMTAMKKNTSVPVSIKIRLEHKFNQEIIGAIQDGGIDFLTVHGRRWTDAYQIPCQYEAIKFFVENLKIPVIGNGDIACISSLKKMFSTGCAGVMISRAGVGQPWLIQKLISEIKNEKFIMPELSEIGRIFIQHITQLSLLLNSENFAILQARKLAKYYARSLTLKEKSGFCDKMNDCHDLKTLKIICMNYFI